MNSPSRLAILIGAQSPAGDFLPGVVPDVGRMNTYLTVPNGGVWLPNEVISLYNPEIEEVLSTIQTAKADYLYVYFSGHGFTNHRMERMLAFKDGNIQDTQLLTNSPRQLILVDACRTHLKRPGAIGRIPWPEEQWLNATGYSAARALFDQFIMDSPTGQVIIHATADNTSAWENPERVGGEFTLAMLDTVFDYQQTMQHGALFLPAVLDYATRLLQNREVEQIPAVVYNTGYLQIPFGIISPNFVGPALRAAAQKPIEDLTLQNALVFTSAVVILYNLFKQS